MAIWQFRLDLIPANALRAKFGTIPVSIPQDLAEHFAWWSDVQPPVGLEARLDAILPKANSWSQEMLIWGDERGDTASICYDNNRKIEWIGFRVDVRQLSLSFVRSICRLAKELDCMLLTAKYHLIAPDDNVVLVAINQSTAKSYLDDPVSTLRSLKQNKGEIVQFPKKDKDKEGPPKE